MSNKRVIVCDVCGKKLVGIVKIMEHTRISFECKRRSINQDLHRIADPKAFVRSDSLKGDCPMSKYTKKERKILTDGIDKIKALTIEQTDEYQRRV